MINSHYLEGKAVYAVIYWIVICLTEVSHFLKSPALENKGHHDGKLILYSIIPAAYLVKNVIRKLLISQGKLRSIFDRNHDIFNKYSKIIVNARPNYGIL